MVAERLVPLFSLDHRQRQTLAQDKADYQIPPTPTVCVQKILGLTTEEDYLSGVSSQSTEYGEQAWQIQPTTKETGITSKKNNRDTDPDTASRKSIQKQRGNQSQQCHL